MSRVALLGDGSRSVVTGRSFVALVEAPVTADLPVALGHLAVIGEATLDDVLDVLVSVPLRSLPDFALVVEGSDGAVAVVRGNMEVRVDAAGRSERFDAIGFRTWRERILPSGGSFSLGDGPGIEGAYGWLGWGVVAAGSVTWIDVADLTAPSAEPPRIAGTEAVDESAGESPAAPSVPLTSGVEPSEVTRIDDWFDTPEAGDGEADQGEADRIEAVPPGLDLEGPPTDGDEPSEPDEVAVNDYDHLFSFTRPRTVEQAAVRVTEAGGPPVVPGTSLPAPPVDSAVPGDVAVTSVPVGSRDDSVQLGDHDGHTRTLASIQAEFAATGASGGGAVPPRGAVAASRCPSNHLNPPHAGVCRVCGSAVPGGTEMIDRAEAGFLVLPDGARVVVDRTVLIGRNPGSDVTFEGELPRLVRLADDKHLSRTHCVIDVSGWTATIVDRGSQNGTVLRAPGRQPELLRAGIPTVVLPGSEIVLAEAVMLRFEVA